MTQHSSSQQWIKEFALTIFQQMEGMLLVHMKRKHYKMLTLSKIIQILAIEKRQNPELLEEININLEEEILKIEESVF
jgi:Na+-transporting methylmalonyl-CoA/oxaloacetate decarboxylase beta subunit